MPLHVFPNGPNSEYHVFNGGDISFVNPLLHFEKKFTWMFQHFRDLQLTNDTHNFSQKLINRARATALAKQDWKKEYERTIATPIPSELMQLLTEVKKKKQLQLLKSITYHTNLFMALPLYAWKIHQMPYSIMNVDYLPKEFDDKKVPALMKVDDNSIEYFGDTNMSTREIKSAMNKRNWVISEFIGDETNWHCFFRTAAGIQGTEFPHEGFPHIHYISSAWGISRENVVGQLSSYRYNLPAATIPFDNSENS